MQIPENYQLFKFKNGQDVIAEVFESPEDKNHLILRRPMQIQIMTKLDPKGNPVPAKLIMIEWLAFSQNDSVVVPRENILCYGKPTSLIAGVYDNEKKRIDRMRANADTETPPPNELDKTDEKISKPMPEQKKAEKCKNKKLKQMIFIQMSIETLMRFLENMGLDIEDEPWKAMVSPPDDDDMDEDDDDDEDEEETPQNLDGRMDIMPDVDGDGWVDPFGNPWSGPEPN